MKPPRSTAIYPCEKYLQTDETASSNIYTYFVECILVRESSYGTSPSMLKDSKLKKSKIWERQRQTFYRGGGGGVKEKQQDANIEQNYPIIDFSLFELPSQHYHSVNKILSYKL